MVACSQGFTPLGKKSVSKKHPGGMPTICRSERHARNVNKEAKAKKAIKDYAD
jgi:hypothetical protein